MVVALRWQQRPGPGGVGCHRLLGSFGSGTRLGWIWPAGLAAAPGLLCHCCDLGRFAPAGPGAEGLRGPLGTFAARLSQHL